MNIEEVHVGVPLFLLKDENFLKADVDLISQDDLLNLVAEEMAKVMESDHMTIKTLILNI